MDNPAFPSSGVSRVWMRRSSKLMQKADITTRAVAGFIDFLLILGLTRLPDVLGLLSASGYILILDGLFDNQSVGKKLVGLCVVSADDPERRISFRESIIRNATLTLAYLLFLVPYAGWILGPLVLGAEALTAIGDDRGMRIGDLLGRTCTVQTSGKSTAQEQPAETGAPGSESSL